GPAFEPEDVVLALKAHLLPDLLQPPPGVHPIGHLVHPKRCPEASLNLTHPVAEFTVDRLRFSAVMGHVF
ncbi:MAG: hypothetical protein NWF14_09870, partial [Candidatus Bathyarchaeota archaeon]|nr:hypothetical protein [Candidatus Bathyarchaeota archaeon]